MARLTLTPRPLSSSGSSENVAKVTTPVVLDASAGVEILLLTPMGRRLLAKLPLDIEEWVPELYFAEVAGVLRRQGSHHRYPKARIDTALGRLLSSPVRRVQVQPLLREARQMRQKLTVAGAVYVVMAHHLGAPLVTTDLRLAATPGLAVSTVVP
jgi:predicted nucleic acid-binding protein